MFIHQSNNASSLYIVMVSLIASNIAEMLIQGCRETCQNNIVQMKYIDETWSERLSEWIFWSTEFIINVSFPFSLIVPLYLQKVHQINNAN